MDAESTRKDRNVCKVLRGKLGGRTPLGKMGTLYPSGSEINMTGHSRVDSSGPGCGPVMCSGEHSNITSAWIKYEKFIGHVQNCYFFKRDELAFKFYEQKRGSKKGDSITTSLLVLSVSMA
jgi:hypothetical protein